MALLRTVPHVLPLVIVSYAITMSLGMTFSKQCNTPLDANQDLFAMVSHAVFCASSECDHFQGAGNLVGSFFGCFPVCGSLARTALNVKLGSMTQVSTLVSCTLLLVVILWMGPVFETLPRVSVVFSRIAPKRPGGRGKTL